MGLEDKEHLDEDPTQEEVADACRDVLDEKTCEAIAEAEDTESALGLAFTALIEAGEDPEEYLKSRGLLE